MNERRGANFFFFRTMRKALFRALTHTQMECYNLLPYKDLIILIYMFTLPKHFQLLYIPTLDDISRFSSNFISHNANALQRRKYVERPFHRIFIIQSQIFICKIYLRKFHKKYYNRTQNNHPYFKGILNTF